MVVVRTQTRQSQFLFTGVESAVLKIEQSYMTEKPIK